MKTHAFPTSIRYFAPVSTPILLCTLNARFIHCAFGLRYLLANLGELKPQAKILEFTISQKTEEIVDQILAHDPQVVGFGIYIWNTLQTLPVLQRLKDRAPHVRIVLGGPEISFETAEQPHVAYADAVICGEGDHLFREFCVATLAGEPPPAQKIIAPRLPEILDIESPYPFYTDEDIRHRVIYVEASRGCPYKCEYCLSSLDKKVRSFESEKFLADMRTLISRGARSFKFVDRTFNLVPAQSTRILQFFLDEIRARPTESFFLHFELVPDRLPPEISNLIRQFPSTSLQFEIGIQTMNPMVTALVSRRQDYVKTRANFEFLTRETHVHIHADLIAGLPGENLQSFARGFDELLSWGPHEIQLGILKRLRGTPIIRHDREYEMRYSPVAPYTILSTRDLSAQEVEEISRFAKFWDHIVNSGRFARSWARIREELHALNASVFQWFWQASAELFARFGRTHAISLHDLFDAFHAYALGYFSSRLAPAALSELQESFELDSPSLGGKRESKRKQASANQRQRNFERVRAAQPTEASMAAAYSSPLAN